MFCMAVILLMLIANVSMMLTFGSLYTQFILFACVYPSLLLMMPGDAENWVHGGRLHDGSGVRGQSREL